MPEQTAPDPLAMRRHVARAVQKALLDLVPGATDGQTTVEVVHASTIHGVPRQDSWQGDVEGFAQRIALALDMSVFTPDAYPVALPWAALMDEDDLRAFLFDLGAASVRGPVRASLVEVQKACATWRLIAETQHAHDTAPGPGGEG